MEPFRIHILGCGSALPTLRHNASSQLVEVRERLLMLDCAEGTQTQMRKSHLHFAKLSRVFISHLHGDHCFGLIGLLTTLGMLKRTQPMHIYAQPDLQKLLQYYKAGTEVALTVQRQDGNGSYAEATIMVTLGTRESIQSAEDQQDSQEQESQGDGAPGQGGQDNGGFGQNGQIEPDPNEGQQQGQEFYNPFEQFGFPGFPFGN